MAITLNKNELRTLFVAAGSLAVALFLLIALVRVKSFGESIGAACYQAATGSISASALILFLAVKSKWTWSWLARLAGRPIVHGVWWGELHSNYQGKSLTIPIAFVIKQTYVSLSIQSFTAAISAESIIEVFDKNEKNEGVRLKYVYEMKREANAEHKFTTGYGDLRLQDGGKVLGGYYWTNSPTEGAIRLELVQRECEGIDSYESVQTVIKSARNGT